MGRERQPATGIEERGESIRITFHYQGQRCRETLRLEPTAKNLRYAELKRNQILYEIELGTFNYGDHFPKSKNKAMVRRKSNLSLQEGISNWLATRVLAKTTRAGYEKSVRNYIPAELRSRAMRSILPSELATLRATLAESQAPKTVNNALIPLRGAFELAHDDGLIKSNPTGRLVNVKIPRKSKADPFSPEELVKLLGKAEGAARNFYEFWALSGLRGGEIIAIEWRDVDWIGSRIHVQRSVVLKEAKDPKTLLERFVELDPAAIAVLKRQQTLTGLAGGVIFINPGTGKPWDHNRTVGTRWERLCKKAQVRHRPPGQLRHTYASLALSAGERPFYVATQLGHTSLQMLELHYAKWMREAAVRAGKSFAEVAQIFASKD